MNLSQQIESLRGMTVGQLKKKYVEVFGEECRSFHKEFLWKRIAWRMQVLAEGDTRSSSAWPALPATTPQPTGLRTTSLFTAQGSSGASQSIQRIRRYKLLCGQFDLIFECKRRRSEEREYLKDVFSRLLLLSEPRGPHATGLAWVNRDGEHRIFKAPVPAREFIDEPGYRETLDGLDNRTTILMGHTRWPTRGDTQNNANNMPLRCGDCLGTHNGTVVNADALFRRFRLRRHAEVDSELIFRLANRLTVEDGRIDLDRLIAKLALFRGQLSSVLVSRRAPGTVLVLKGDKPLSLWLHPKRRVIAYASEETYLHETLSGDKGWRTLDISAMTLAVFDHKNIRNFTTLPFHFTIQSRRCIMPRGVST